MIQELTATPELDKSYLGRVERITDFGAFIEIMPGVDGLLHVSEIANYRVKDVRDELKEGEQIMVKVINVDPVRQGPPQPQGAARARRRHGAARSAARARRPAAGGDDDRERSRRRPRRRPRPPALADIEASEHSASGVATDASQARLATLQLAHAGARSSDRRPCCLPTCRTGRAVVRASQLKEGSCMMSVAPCRVIAAAS